MKFFLTCLAVFLLLLSSCGTGDVADFECDRAVESDVAAQIAAHIKTYAEVSDCTAEVDGDAATLSLDLAGTYDDAQIVALKRKIVADVRGRYVGINRVAISTALDIFEKAAGEPEGIKENEDKDVFDIPAPTL